MPEVRLRYSYDETFHTDNVAHNAAGRVSDFSGAGFGERDLGWVCKSELEAQKIYRALKRAGFHPELKG